MLRIFTDRELVSKQNRKIIFPLLFDLCYIKNIHLLKSYSLVNSILESDIVIVPVDIGHYFKNNEQDYLYSFIDNALMLGKKVWVYTAGDFGITLKKEVYTFRLGGFESKFDDKTFILPSFISDPYVDSKKAFIPIAKKDKPRIGFVGHASNTFLKKLKEFSIYGIHNLKRFKKTIFSDYQYFYPSSIKRFKCLMAYKQNQFIETDFIFRDKYRAGAVNSIDRENTSKVFFDNIFENPYTFCLRGVGNFSVRFYEVLAMGRIPVVVYTDFRLPLAQRISWENHCVIVSEQNYVTDFISFHKRINQIEFEQMQINNRKLWLNLLTREAFFIEIHTIFKELI